MKNCTIILAILAWSTPLFAQPHRYSTIVLPFTMINGGSSQWVSDSVQQSLQADLRNASISHTSAGTDDAASLSRIAHNTSADYLVDGQVQINEDQVRLTATMYNSAGVQVATAKSTGNLKSLFDLEDSLAEQLRDGLSRTIASQRKITTPIPTVEPAGAIRVAAAKTLPIGTVPASYSSAALRDGHDRYLYQIPIDGCFGGCGGSGYGGFSGGFGGGFGGGGFGFGGFGGVFNGSYSTGGGHSLAW